jgi:hypothetical protein
MNGFEDGACIGFSQAGDADGAEHIECSLITLPINAQHVEFLLEFGDWIAHRVCHCVCSWWTREHLPVSFGT